MSNTATLTQCYRQGETAVVADVGGQMVALDVRQGICFGMNACATRIWHMLDGTASIDSIADQLMDIYEVDRATCLSQTTALLEQLEAKNLVVRC